MTDIYGLKIAPAGVEVTTAPEDQLSFISSRQILKVAGVGISTGPVSIAHGFGYVPAYLVFQNYTSGGDARVRSAGSMSVYADTTYLHIPGSDTYKYYVFYKQAV